MLEGKTIKKENVVVYLNEILTIEDNSDTIVLSLKYRDN